MKIAQTPFRSVTASYLTRIGKEKATTLTALGKGLECCLVTADERLLGLGEIKTLANR